MGVYGSPELNNTLNTEQTHYQNMGYCIYCGFYYPNKLKKCPRCGQKKKTRKNFKWLIWLVFAIIVISALGRLNSDGTDQTSNDVVKTNKITGDAMEEIVISEDEYKAQCANIQYDNIARNPNNYIGQKTVYTGKVVQIQENGKHVVLRINVTQGDYGFWDDTIYVDYCKNSDNESRILEDDIITIYGDFIGIKNYTAVLGNQISIPHIQAEYIDIN